MLVYFAEINTVARSSSGEKRFVSSYTSQSVFKGSHGRNLLAKTQADHRRTLFTGLFLRLHSLLFNTAYVHLPGGGFTHSGLGPHFHQENVPQICLQINMREAIPPARLHLARYL